MKNHSLKLKLASLVLFFATTALLSMEPNVDAGINVYISNATAYPILVKAKPTMSASTGKGKFEQKQIPPNGFTFIGQLKDIANIDTSGKGALTWTSNEKALKDIKNAAHNKKNVDAYLEVHYSYTQGYYIKSAKLIPAATENKPIYAEEEWPSEKRKSTEEAPDWKTTAVTDLPQLQLTLQNVVKQNSLGQDYAKMVIEICNTDYTKAEQSGASNICSDLKRMFTRGLSEADAKRIIDGMYARLKMYKTPQGITKIIYVD